MRTVLLILLAAGLGLAGTPRAGAQTAVQERLQQNELRQQQIRTSTQRVGDQLQALISEFERNGLAGDEVETLRAIQSVLGDHQDSVVSRAHLLREADAAHAAGEDTFTYGLLYQLEEELAQRCREQLGDALKALRRSISKDAKDAKDAEGAKG